METVATAILDKFPNLRQYKVWVVLFVAIFGYIGGLIFTTNVRSRPNYLAVINYNKKYYSLNRVECFGFN